MHTPQFFITQTLSAIKAQLELENNVWLGLNVTEEREYTLP